MKLFIAPISNNHSMVNDLVKHHFPSILNKDIKWCSLSFIHTTFEKAALLSKPQVVNNHEYRHIDNSTIDELCNLIQNLKLDSWQLQHTWY